MSVSMIIFDDGKGSFGPMTDLRAVFEVRTGMLTTAGRIIAHRPDALAGYWVPDRLVAVVRERVSVPVNSLPDGDEFYCANGRWAFPDLQRKLAKGEALIEAGTGDVIAARLLRDDARQLLSEGTLPDNVERQEEHGEALLYRYPWDVIRLLRQSIANDILQTRILDAKVLRPEIPVIGDRPVEVHRTAVIHPQVVFDAELGPIMIHEGAVCRPGAILCGPCSIGPGSTVVDRALIKPNTVIGPHCKVGGEVGGTIFQGYANKGHDGHLGDSWVGKWVNFGAGTSNSNLLNTYGEIRMRVEPDASMSKTGQTFLGGIFGDHVKMAINTSITTGSVLGTGAMIAMAGFPPQTVRRFAWMTDRGEQTFRFEKFMVTAAAMMRRRDLEPTDAYTALLRDLHGRATSS